MFGINVEYVSNVILMSFERVIVGDGGGCCVAGTADLDVGVLDIDVANVSNSTLEVMVLYVLAMVSTEDE